MAINTSEVQKAYLAYFGRPADTAGLAYWQTQDAITMKAGFAASNEYATLYTGMTAEERVEQVYQNLLGRASDVTGKAYWVAEFNAGRATVSSLVDAMQTNALNDDITTINNRVAYANDFTAALDTQAEVDGYVGTASANTARTAVATVLHTTTSLSTAQAAMATSVASVVAASTTTGRMADGYIEGATVFADANGDGIWNAGEAKDTTDANGAFTMHGATGKLIASGGTDIATNLAFTGMMVAPDGSGMVNPLTTVMQSMVDSGTSLAQAQTKVLAALGLPSSVNLQTLDAIAVAVGSGSTADKAVAAQVQAAAAKVANILVQGTSTIQGASSTTSATDAMANVATALANNFAAATTTVDLTQATVLKSVMSEAAAATSTAATTAVTASLDNIASVMSSANTKVDDAIVDNPTDFIAALSQIAKVQVVAQGETATSLQTGMAAGSIDSTVSSFTGTALDSAVTAAEAGDLTPDVPATDGTPPPPTDGGGSPPATTFTVTEDGSHILQFTGTATGAITVSITGTDATFTRGGINSAVIPLGTVTGVQNDAPLTLTKAQYATLAASLEAADTITVSDDTLSAAEIATLGADAKVDSIRAATQSLTKAQYAAASAKLNVGDTITVNDDTLTAAEIATLGADAKVDTLTAASANLNVTQYAAASAKLDIASLTITYAANESGGLDVVTAGANVTVVDAALANGSVTISAGAGTQTITGSTSDDVIIGGAGADTIIVNGGHDVVAFTAANDGSAAGVVTGFDAITGFTLSSGAAADTDKFQFGGTLFATLDDNSNNAIAAVSRAQTAVNATTDEMVFLSTALTDTAFADPAFAAFRTAIGAVNVGFTTGAEVLVVANDGTNTGIYLITSLNNDATVDANEVQLLSTVNGILTHCCLIVFRKEKTAYIQQVVSLAA